MKKYLIVLTYFVLAIASRCVLGDAPPSYGLTLTAVAGNQQIPPAPNSPIWIDLIVKNTGLSPFDGGYHDCMDNGAVAVTSPVTDSVRKKCINGGLSGAAGDLKLDTGDTKVFHVMLNGMLPAIKPGVISGWIVLPLFAETGPKWAKFTLDAPFTVKTGRPLTPDELTNASNQLIQDVISGGRDLSDQAMHSLDALPDHYAVHVLATLLGKVAPDGGYYVYLLGTRPRTPDSIKALQDIAQSNYPALSAQAKGYLTQASDNKTP